MTWLEHLGLSDRQGDLVMKRVLDAPDHDAVMHAVIIDVKVCGWLWNRKRVAIVEREGVHGTPLPPLQIEVE